MPRTLLCLATRKGLAVAESLRRADADRLAVCTFHETGVVHAFDADIHRAAGARGIPVIPLARWREDPLGVVAEHGIERILCVGWRYLVDAATADAVGGDVIVAHDSLLPKLRGFAPLPTALLTGETRTGVTFLRACDRVDAGGVYWQAAVGIGPRDTIADLIDKVVPLYVEGARALLAGEFGDPVPQDEDAATFSLWRDDADYRIDWSLDAAAIERAVRALGDPYPGARSTLGGRAVVIHRAAVLPEVRFALRQPGKLWSLGSGGEPEVVCGAGLLRIEHMTFGDGSPALPLTRLRQRFGA
ncbi:methionyl-tRNA formyltransferase [Phycisphaera mikurensis]|uniref:Methionyl-tRNA formyltransferase n=1 Tax=Phycisphaera mikurensis (strain NBRC 102666 / KCTC 22515 / FYK2301M01) TaxID=1142394 RepID=I0IBF3_PHYMF|nr:formyltransferase family protein [Phycisphaera mikurensis]MBB6442876.1 methionyl-tRNA formyltransferase [Phycisphaera mikurensis]BAM02591.1 putative formyltransferase [Phycisphaera mikurensis NBRC 102666]